MAPFHAALAVLALSGTGSGQTVMLDFYADWCGPCRAMDATVHELADQGYPVRRVNIEQQRDLAASFHVQSIPCFVMLVNGREADRVEGIASIGRLEQMCRLGQVATAPAPPPVPADRVPNPPVMPAAFVPNPPVVAAAPGPNPPPAPVTMADAALAAGVRLRIEDQDGHSCGSGTIIDAVPGGEALVLTCGHLFRDSQGRGRIEVDLFGSLPARHVPGRLIAYDLKRDVALVAIRPPGAVTVARVAPPGYSVRVGDPVASVGCSNGDDPTLQRTRVNALDRCLGPPNLQVAGQPVVGRSGGGLFSSDGLVIGVCNAAYPSEPEGLFAALGAIQAELDEQGLSRVYRPEPAGLAAPAAALAVAPAPPAAAPPAAPARPSGALASVDPAAAGRPPLTPRTEIGSPDRAAATARPEAGAAAPLAPNVQDALDVIGRRMREGAEVVCIIRDRRDPQAKSQVITMDHALVQQLSADAQAEQSPQQTSLAVPQPRTPILEWDARQGWIHREALPR
jgi:thiol-disulfide isomerase/thioredoxin